MVFHQNNTYATPVFSTYVPSIFRCLYHFVKCETSLILALLIQDLECCLTSEIQVKWGCNGVKCFGFVGECTIRNLLENIFYQAQQD